MRSFQRVEIQCPELVPLGDDHGDISLFSVASSALASPDHARQQLLGILSRVRVVDSDRRSLLQHGMTTEARRFAHVVGVRLEGDTKHRDRFARELAPAARSYPEDFQYLTIT
jgi:hypothetical protein